MFLASPITFPNLGITVDPNPVAFTVFGKSIYWYGIIIAAGFLLAVLYMMHRAKDFGITQDDVLDMVLWAVPIGVICARAYYCIFYWELYRDDPISVLYIWEGGLAIYGGIIGGALTLLVVAKVKKIPAAVLLDLAAMAVIIGQFCGRWGNFMNREAFGTETTLPWRMELTTVLGKTVDVHPTFLYESLWNVVGLLLIVFVVSKARRFDGENTWFYFLWYGIGRFWIEGLRTDSLYLFDWTIGDQPIRVSQALSLVMVLVSAFMLFYNIKLRPHKREELYVNIVAARKAAAAADSEAATVEAPAPAAAEPAAAPVTDAGRTEPVSEPTDAASEAPEVPPAPETPAEPQGPTE